jgi:arginase
MSVNQTVIKRLAYLGAAIHEGGIVKGVENGPRYIRESGVFDRIKKMYEAEVVDYGDVKAEKEHGMYPPVEHPVRNLNVLGPLLEKLHNKVYDIASKKSEDFLLTIGGDHSVGAGVVAGIARAHRDLRVVWIDAHPDTKNTDNEVNPKMHNYNYCGFPLSHVSGLFNVPKNLKYWDWISKVRLLDPKNVVIIGVNDITRQEEIVMKKNGLKVFSMDHIDKYGIGEVMGRTIEYLDPKNEHPFHLEIDIDAIDPAVIQQTGALVRHGLTARESIHIVRRLTNERKLISMDIAEISEVYSPNEPRRKKYRGEGDLKEMS